MKGEKLAWFRLASHLRLPVVVCRSIIPISEVRDWPHYFDYVDDHEHSKVEWLLAQICYYLSTGVRLKKDVKMDSFFPKKTTGKDVQASNEDRRKKIRANMVNFVTVGKILEQTGSDIKVK